MEALRQERCGILDFRSHHDERMRHVTNELYLRDATTTAPPLDVEFAAVTRRIGHLLAVLSPLFAHNGGTVRLDRWLPGTDDDDGDDGGDRYEHSDCQLASDGELPALVARRTKSLSSAGVDPADGAGDGADGCEVAAPLAHPAGSSNSPLDDEEDADEAFLAGGYKAQRPRTLEGYVHSSRVGARRGSRGRACSNELVSAEQQHHVNEMESTTSGTRDHV